jgi:hypothetical protein
MRCITTSMGLWCCGHHPCEASCSHPYIPRIWGGCLARAPHLCMVVWPLKFWPHLLEKYDGSVNLVEFLHIYTISILVVGGNEAVMANYFLVTLTGTARSWLMNLP